MLGISKNSKERIILLNINLVWHRQSNSKLQIWPTGGYIAAGFNSVRRAASFDSAGSYEHEQYHNSHITLWKVTHSLLNHSYLFFCFSFLQSKNDEIKRPQRWR